MSEVTKEDDRPKFVETNVSADREKPRTRALTIGGSRVAPTATTTTTTTTNTDNMSTSPSSASSSFLSTSPNGNSNDMRSPDSSAPTQTQTSTEPPMVVQIGSPPKNTNGSVVKKKSNSSFLSVKERVPRSLKPKKKIEYDQNDLDNANRIVAIKDKDTKHITVIMELDTPGPTRDMYGFVFDGLEFIEELHKFEKAEEEKAAKKLESWTAFNEQYRHVGLFSNPKQLHKLLSNGIPHEIRFSLWKIYSGAVEKQRKEEIELFKKQREEKISSRLRGIGTIRGLTPPTQRKSYYQHLHHIIRTSNRMSTRFQSIPEIDKDISRTFPGHAFFESDEGQRKLTRVLQAYSVRNRKVGYCQSMNIVAGYLLFVMNKNEEDAFWLLSTIVEDYCHNYYSTNLLGAQVDMIVFDHLTQTHLPTLYNHLSKCSVSLTLLSTKWFMCLYIGILPNEIVFRIWDHLFVECGIYGRNKPATESEWLRHKETDFKCLGFASYNLLLTGLAILAFMEESLLKCHSTPQLLTTLSNEVKGIFNAKKFFKKFNSWKEKISQEDFAEYKKGAELKLIQELEDMRKLRDLSITAKITRFSKTDLEKIWTGFRNLNLSMSSSRVSMGKSLKLDFNLFRKVFSYILPASDNNGRDVLVQQLFKVFDKDKDGSLDFSELMSGLCILAKGTSEERLKLYFSFFDSDNSGFVSKEEMKLMLQTVYEKIELDPLAVTQYTIEEYVDIVFSNLGIVNDQLSFDNFRQAILSYPRIFRCFMIEEETFINLDFEEDEDFGNNNNNNNGGLSSDEDDNNSNQDALSAESSTQTSPCQTPTTSNIPPSILVADAKTTTSMTSSTSNEELVSGGGGSFLKTSAEHDDNEPKRSKSKLNLNSKGNTLKSSTSSMFKSSLIQAIEHAQKDQATPRSTLNGHSDGINSSDQSNNNTSAGNPSVSTTTSQQTLDTPTKTTSPPMTPTSPKIRRKSIINSGEMTMPPSKDGHPLSCCKFM
ncbi:hypothetical protein SAMD00019534_050060 [Acytostelium subglobosum LB1]|uniref:hypothetical protein n=1 Tax=Acytostelium subglobosum LB1 TaxID=1410327 RepID=UPI000644AFD0|nr:hypothetical protein SAMD00019534_050060 [Acytostelium subglobosum LB1]GAM21831.1 hypothetical protein SAMD00019534_050060 [Acytostelium subglobosum LB1]|eukprot:XP_012754931.1 hypothetical protein SAMD00019534_050060 [Acytostelium subglobosum LB1]